MNDIFLYCDKGACSNCLRATAHVLKALGRVYFVDHKFFLTDGWESRAALVFFPGGRDVPYHEALRGEANRRIRKYVENGGKFMGICAGGYYGSSYVSFDEGGSLEVSASRELKFFPGTAYGPALKKYPFSYDHHEGARAISISLSEAISNKMSMNVYYHGGCFFLDAELYPNVQILARYAEPEQQEAAVILCTVGMGKVLLSGVHPEYHSQSEQICDLPMRSLLERDPHFMVQLLAALDLYRS